MGTAARLLVDRPTPADLTIALCTIGRQGFLQTAIRSVLKTTPPQVTLHIVLNGPDDPHLGDEIRTLLAEWAGPATITEVDKRLTIAGSHNTALAACSTEFITFMGDDDLVLEPRVERILERFWTTSPTPAVIGSYCRRVSGSYDNPRFSTNKDYGPTTIEDWQRERDRGDLIEIVFPSAVYRTELLRSINGFEERFGSAMDLATFTILGQEHPVLADPRRSFAHRIHDGSVTSSSAAQHAARLRYTEAAIAALRADEPQPVWEEFIESTAPIATRATDQRKMLSATLFRQGGAAAASGDVLTGLSKMAASAALSPRTFLSRSKSQVSREPAGQTVTTIVVDSVDDALVPFYTALRQILRDSHDIELRLVIAGGASRSGSNAPSLAWAEYRPFRQLSLVGKTIARQPAFDVTSGVDLLITEASPQALAKHMIGHSRGKLGTRVALWASDSEAAQPRLVSRVHWVFAANQSVTDTVVASDWPAERTTTISSGSPFDAQLAARSFASGVREAVEAPST